jgi:hypothetical protein
VSSSSRATASHGYPRRPKTGSLGQRYVRQCSPLDRICVHVDAETRPESPEPVSRLRAASQSTRRGPLRETFTLRRRLPRRPSDWRWLSTPSTRRQQKRDSMEPHSRWTDDCRASRDAYKGHTHSPYRRSHRFSHFPLLRPDWFHCSIVPLLHIGRISLSLHFRFPLPIIVQKEHPRVDRQHTLPFAR